jgi:hypothetical protein
VVVDPFAEVCSFSYVLFMKDITADKRINNQRRVPWTAFS